LGHEVVSGYSQHQGQHLLQFAVNFLVNFWTSRLSPTEHSIWVIACNSVALPAQCSIFCAFVLAIGGCNVLVKNSQTSVFHIRWMDFAALACYQAQNITILPIGRRFCFQTGVNWKTSIERILWNWLERLLSFL
jgi:hypothetical protein